MLNCDFYAVILVLHIDLWQCRQSRIYGTGCFSCVNKKIAMRVCKQLTWVDSRKRVTSVDDWNAWSMENFIYTGTHVRWSVSVIQLWPKPNQGGSYVERHQWWWLWWWRACGESTYQPRSRRNAEWGHEYSCPVSWGCRIHRLHLCRGVGSPQWVSCIWH